MAVYAKPVKSSNPKFQGRVIAVAGSFSEARIPVPDNVVLCNGCNSNIADTEEQKGYLIYLGKRELKADQPYDIYCQGCLGKYFPKVIMV